jgi:hypothetical protein
VIAQNVPDVKDAAVTAARAEVGVALVRALWPKSVQSLLSVLLQHTPFETEVTRKRSSLTTSSHHHVAAGLEDAVPLLVVHPLRWTLETEAGARASIATPSIATVASLRLVSQLLLLLVSWIVCVAVQGAARSLAPRAELVQVCQSLLLDWVVLLLLVYMSEVRLAKKLPETTHPIQDVPDPDPDPAADLFPTPMMSLACVELRVIPRL